MRVGVDECSIVTLMITIPQKESSFKTPMTNRLSQVLYSSQNVLDLDCKLEPETHERDLNPLSKIVIVTNYNQCTIQISSLQ